MRSGNSQTANDGTALPAHKENSSFWRRIVSAAVLVPPVLAIVYVGSPYFEGLVLLMAAGLAHEWARLCGSGGLQPTGWALLVLVVLTVAAAMAGPDRVALGLLAVGTGGLYLAGRFEKEGNGPWLAGGVLYVVIPCIACLWLRQDSESGRAIFFWLLGVVWVTDIAAYAFGRAIGGPKLAPHISPNKTWAGLVGAILLAGLAGWGLAQGLGLPASGLLGAFGALLAVVAQAGDLGESAVKRHFGVKDTGKLIPGHGGLMDRLDGLLIAAPVVMLVKWTTESWVFP
ncbi:MAG: phosphatidate cytidylyltransferase [Alphaproteobacteria bacterium]|nr:phosphatidate cytidylyltransferase [Alphaproteobacteria bacterium]